MKKDIRVGVWVGGLLCVIIVFLFGGFIKDVRHKDRDQIQKVRIKDTLAFQDSVLNFIFELRLEHPYIVYSQALIESKNFTSSIWKENNNMFGMKMPERRPTVAIGISRGHSTYRSWRDCLIDYALFQSSYLRGLTEEEYFMKVGSFYAEDKVYESKIREMKKLVR